MPIKLKRGGKIARDPVREARKIVKTVEKAVRSDRARPASRALVPVKSRKNGGSGTQLTPYAKTLINPAKYGGVRIPDFNALPSVTFSIQERLTVTTGAAGTATCVLGYSGNSAVPGSLLPTFSAVPASTFAAACTSVTGTTADIFTGAAPVQLPGWTSSTDTIPTLYSHVRLVSATLTVTGLGSLATMQGKLSGAFLPKAQLAEVTSVWAFGLTLLENVPGAVILPVNSEKGLTLRYSPADMDCFEYMDTATISPTVIQEPWCYPGVLVAFCSGMSSGVSVQVSAVLNYEALPFSTAESIGLEANSSPSPVDPLALAQGMAVSTKTPTAVASNAANTGGYGAQPRVGHRSTAVDKLQDFGGSLLDRVIGVANKGLDKAESFIGGMI